MAEGQLPQGVVTFVFTDIEGSTRLLQSDPEAYPGLLSRHHELIAAALEAGGGCLVRTDGDGSFWAFASPTQALASVVAAQRDLLEDEVLDGRVRVRVGLHTGETEILGDDDYVGLAVHHAARVANAGHGGQILVTGATRAAMSGEGPVDLVSLGEHRLKDLARPVPLFQVAHPGLPSRFPPLRSLRTDQVRLPRHLTSFHGRESELDAVVVALGDAGIVTLTGPGGTGKTRLAIEVSRVLSSSLEGTWFVDLQAVAADDEVAPAVAAQIGAAETVGSEDSLMRVNARVGGQRCLIVLDNCEQVLTGAAAAAKALLAACPELRILATSREMLGIDFERSRRTLPLDPQAASDLFVERAGRVVPQFDPGPEERAAISRICVRLDGIPLAIELAAVRLRHLSCAELEEGLADRFGLLTGGPNRSTERHATLQAVVDWSYDLLSDAERDAFTRLAVFPGTFDGSAAAAVLAAGAEPMGLDLLYRLVDRSLVEHDGAGRYRMLETIRAYGYHLLVQSGEASVAKEAHARYFAELTARHGWALDRAWLLDHLEQLEPELGNVRMALESARATGDQKTMLQLVEGAAPMAGLLKRMGLFRLSVEVARELPAERAVRALVQVAGPASLFRREGRHELVELAAEAAAAARDDLLIAWVGAIRGFLLIGDGDAAGARRAVEAVLMSASVAQDSQLWGALQILRGIALTTGGEIELGRSILEETAAMACSAPQPTIWDATALLWAGVGATQADDWEAAIPHYTAVLPLFRRVRYQVYTQWALDHLSRAHLQVDSIVSAQAFAEEGVRLSHESGLGRGTNLHLLYETLARLSVAQEDLLQACEYYVQALALVAFEDDSHAHVALKANLASAACQMGDTARAHQLLTEAIRQVTGLVDQPHPLGGSIPPPVDNVVLATARLAHAQGDGLTAVELTAAARAHTERPDTAPVLAKARRRWIDELRAELGEEAYEGAVERGIRAKDRLSLAVAYLKGATGDADRKIMPATPE